MDSEKRAKLEAAGWKVGDAADFLELTPAEAALVEMRLALSRSLRTRRRALRLSQASLARQIGSSQARVARAEAADPEVSTDFLFRALLSTGATPADLARVLDEADASALPSRPAQPRAPRRSPRNAA